MLEGVELSALMRGGTRGGCDKAAVREAQVAVMAMMMSASAGLASVEAWEARVSGTMVVSGRLGRLDTLGGRVGEDRGGIRQGLLEAGRGVG